ncbi:MAG: prephenate dehydratase [Bacteroidales bacterium]|nr:prephenate dehydratase [Bacteroidales bacterium]
MKKVAIQGIAGCFHDAAARQYFNGEEIEIVECDTFHDLFDKLDADASMIGIVAIENTIAGSLLTNHELLRRSNLRVVGETKMRISHVLCALPGETIENIKEVNSHPMALMQCEQFLHRHRHFNIVEKNDTAGSARDIARDGLKGYAAVCGKYGAELYGLDILAEGIETNKRNFTRFLIVADPLVASEMTPRAELINKSSIEFTLPHDKGALAKILTIFSFYDINLSKIQSLPIVGREWEYRFYVDLTFDSYVRYKQAIDAVRPLMNDFKILGEYVECENPRD